MVEAVALKWAGVVLALIFPFFAQTVKCRLGIRGNTVFWAVYVLTMAVSLVVVLGVELFLGTFPHTVEEFLKQGGEFGAIVFTVSQAMYRVYKAKLDSFKCE